MASQPDLRSPDAGLIQQALDALDDPIFVKDAQHRFVAFNDAFCRFLGHPREALVGRSDPDFLPAEQVAVFWTIDDEIIATGKPNTNEERITLADGVGRTIWTRKFPVRDAAGAVIGVCAIVTDISELRRRRDQISKLEGEIAEKAALIADQNALLEELGVPVIQIWNGILLLPLIGALDSRRAGRVLENMLEAIGAYAAEVVILDITGVPVVDTGVASHLIRAVQAAQLLGCRSILVGISAEIAQTLVGLGIDFSRITIRSTLQNGLEYALHQLNYEVHRSERP